MAICLLQSGGMVLVFLVQKYQVQNEMAEKLGSRQTRFSKLCLSGKEYREDQIGQNEVSLQGKFYDVKSVTVSGDKVELLVINDVNEENIVEKIGQFFSSSSRRNHPLPDNLVRLLTLDYVCPAPVGYVFKNVEFLHQQAFVLPNAGKVISLAGDVSFPPPKAV
jgi:hypothetical protein